MALTVRLAAGDHGNVARLVNAYLADSPGAADQPFPAHARRRADAGDSDIGTYSHPQSLAALARFCLALRDLVVSDHLQRPVEGHLVVAGVVGPAQAIVVWELLRAYHILPTDFGRVHPDLAGEHIDQALNQEHGLHATGPARRSEHDRVGEGHIHLIVGVRDRVRAGDAATGKDGGSAGPVGGRVAAQVDVIRHRQRRNLAIAVARQRRVLLLATRVHGRARQPFTAIYPLHRAAHFSRQHQHQGGHPDTDSLSSQNPRR